MLIRSLLSLAWSSLGSRRFVALLTVACIGLGSAVLIVVEQIRMEAREAFTRSVSGVDLIVGPRGGSVELLMGVVFRTGTPGPGMSFESYRQIAALPGVTSALPVSFGDSHHGYPVMGTEADYFNHFRYGRSQPLAFAAGKPFSDTYDAVIGAEVAARLGYQLNQQICLEHGLEASMDSRHHHHDKPFRVVGILKRTGTAVDRTVHVSLAGIEAMHADWENGRPPDEFDMLSAEEARLMVQDPERISAMLVALDQRAAALFMQAHLENWQAEPLSAVMPGPVLLELWEIVGVAENVLRGMSWCVITVVLVGMLTVLWSGLEERRREMAVLRAVGARPRHIFLLIIGEALLLTLGGVLAGIFIAALTLSALENTLVQHYGLSLSAAFSWSTIAPLFSGLLAAGLLAGLLPAMRCYLRSLSDGLSPETGG
jgi:putative ABC transport system permease protein